MNYKLINILIGSIYFFAAAVTFSCQRIIIDMYNILPLPSGTYNKGGLLFQDSNDLILLILSIFFFCLGVYFTFFSEIGKPKGQKD